MLVSARISGQREHQGEIVAKAEWPAIITPAETQRLRAKLNDPDRRTNRSARRYLLPSLLRCHHCGSKLVSRPRDDGARRYVCASGPNFGGCGKTTVMAEPLEQYVVEAVLHRLDSPDLPRALNGSVSTDPAGEEWQAEVERAQEQLDELADMWGEREITRGEWVTARAPIEKRLDTAKQPLAAINRTTELAPHLGNAGVARTVADDDPEPAETDRRRAPTARRRRAGAARLQPLRPGPLDRCLALLSPSARAARPRFEAPRGRPPSPATPARGRSPRPRPAPARVADHPAQAHQ